MRPERASPRGQAQTPAEADVADDAPPSLAPELEELIRRFTARKDAPGTRKEYAKWLRHFVRTRSIGSFGELVAVTPDDVVEYRNDLQAEGLSESTINGRLAAVRGLYGLLHAERRIPGNPTDTKLIKGLRVSPVSRTEGISQDEVRAILATCDGTLRGLRDRALLMTLFYEGLRRSEASKLRWRDLTTKKGLLEIKGAKNNPYDTVRLEPRVRRAIDDYQEVLNRELQRRDTGPDDPVFCSLNPIRGFGKRLAPSSINEIVKERAKAAGIKRRISAHSWRHTCTTEALATGTPIHQVQRHLRHKNIQTTLGYDRARATKSNPTIDNLPKL